MPLISIIIPVYNVERYLHKCINSVLCQTYKNIELILVDDGSTDHSGKICDEYSNGYTNVSVVHQKNAGVSSARNKGLDIAKGDYVFFLDSDDFLELNAIEKLILNGEADFIISKGYQITQNAKITIDNNIIKSEIIKMMENTVDNTVDSYFGIHNETENTEEFLNYLRTALDVEYDLGDGKSPEQIKKEVLELVLKKYEEKEEEIGSEQLRELERIVLLRTVDAKWMDHLDAMDQLKEAVRLEAYAQKDPVVEYKCESYDVFNAMTEDIAETVVKTILHVQKRNENMQRINLVRNMITNLNAAQNAGGDDKAKPKVNSTKKVGRNDPCPCGSGKKYKNCCGKNA